MSNPNNASSPTEGVTVLIVARAAVGAAPLKEMQRFAEIAERHARVERALFAFTEQGRPSLREVVDGLVGAGCRTVLIIPLILPFEPAFLASLTRTLQRWRAGDVRPWPEFQVTTLAAGDNEAAAILRAAVDGTATMIATDSGKAAHGESMVPAQKRRVLVCMGAPCHAMGAETIWGHLRNEQERLSLRTAADGTMSAKASCLGPCNLAPVLQVWPEGTFYGGVDENGIDEIIQSHLLDGRVVENLAYHPTGKKQALRPRGDR